MKPTDLLADEYRNANRFAEARSIRAGALTPDQRLAVQAISVALEALKLSALPATAPHAPGNQASKKAAQKVKTNLSKSRLAVLGVIKASGALGATGSEIAGALDMNLYTAKPRCTELRDAGFIYDSCTVRDNGNGNPETVWLAKPLAHIVNV